jgi:hypothetical protein
MELPKNRRESGAVEGFSRKMFRGACMELELGTERECMELEPSGSAWSGELQLVEGWPATCKIVSVKKNNKHLLI